MLRGRPFKKGDKAINPLPKGNQIAVKHSLHVYRRILNGGRLDGRTSLHKVLREKEQELISALGGDPSPQERLIIADAVKTILYIGTLDEYLMNLDGGIVRGNKVIPVIETRTQLATHLRRDLETLGLKRVAKDSLSLEAYVREKYGSRNGEIEQETMQSGRDDQDSQPEANHVAAGNDPSQAGKINGKSGA
jgi:hypothetical protein